MHLFLGAIGCLCLLRPGLWAEECSQDVLGARENFSVPAGHRLSLSCVVQHCGDPWTGTLTRTNSKDDNITARHRLSNVSLSATQSLLTLSFPSVDLLDEGFYGCSVKWARGDTQRGHLMYVNVTAADPESTQKAEVVDADISQHAPGQQGADKEPNTSTTYSAIMSS